MSKNIIVESDCLNENITTVDLYDVALEFQVQTLPTGTVCVSLIFDNNILENLGAQILNHIVDIKANNGKHTNNREYKKESKRLRILPANQRSA